MVRFHIHPVCALVTMALLSMPLVEGRCLQDPVREARSGSRAAATLRGTVLDSRNRPVAGATVSLRLKDAEILAVHSDAAGAYLFREVRQGTYILRAEMPGYDQSNSGPFVLAATESRTVDLTLNVSKDALPRTASEARPEFFDEPHFTVAGVTDTTNLGGHGSDVVARNRESLAQATVALGKHPGANSALNSSVAATEQSLRETAVRRPAEFEANYRLGKFLVDEAKPQEALPYLERASRLNPGDFDNAFESALAYAGTGNYAQAAANARALLTASDRSRQQKGELHHLLGDVAERAGDALAAVQDYQSAAELEPSETNLFDWGAELLIHHAADPAVEVFTKGNQLFPRSVRMLTGLGAAWYSLGSYDQAARRLCEASDLSPDDPAPYLFMGKMQAFETRQSDAILQRLARFAQFEPQNALANYYYAVGLRKERGARDDVKDDKKIKSLLEKAVLLDPKLGLAYLELGIIYTQQKDIPKAISVLQAAIEATPQLEQAHYRLAQLYRQNGDAPKAKAELQQYEEISAEKTKETERQRRELQQFVYELR